MAAYNIAAWCYRRERHLGINAVVYSLAVMWEVRQTSHHIGRFEAPQPARADAAVVDPELERAA
jgi:hypothetical protein